jgi:hypothetical protein
MPKITLNNFSGGAFRNDFDTKGPTHKHRMLPQASLLVAENVVLNSDGSMKSRGGWFKVCDFPTSWIRRVIQVGTDDFLVFGQDWDSDPSSDYKVWRYQTGVMGAGVELTPFTDAISVNGRYFIISSTAGVIEYDLATQAETPIASSPNGHFLHYHGDRLWTFVNDLLQATAVFDFDNWTDGYSVEILDNGEPVSIRALATIDNDLFVFAASGIFLVTGYAENEFFITKFSDDVIDFAPYAKITLVNNLVGIGKALMFIDSFSNIKAMNRSVGVKSICEPFGELSLRGSIFTSIAFLDDSNLLLVGDGSRVVCVHCDSPYQDKSGRIQFPATTHVSQMINAKAIRFVSKAKVLSPVDSAELEYGLVFAANSLDANTAIYLFRQSDYLKNDTHPPSDYDGTNYREVIPRFRIGPTDFGIRERKHWKSVEIETAPPNAAQFQLVQYLDNTESNSVTTVETPGETTWFPLYGFSEQIMLEFTLSKNTTASATEIDCAIDIRSVAVEV